MRIEKIAIVGAGRMGRILIDKLTSWFDLLVIDKDYKKLELVNKEYNIKTTDNLNAVSLADLIILALPGDAVQPVIELMNNYIRDNQIIVNIATNVTLEMISQKLKSNKLVSAKIIGHFHEIKSGEIPIVVLDNVLPYSDLKRIESLLSVFSKIGITVFGNEKMVKKINTIASEEGIRAAFYIKEKLKKEGIPEDLIRFAIRNVASGTMKAFASGDIGPFAQKIIQKIKDDN
ncbi:MAG: hypothetical protein PWP21_157 [Thermosediminibacterales bacterium]|nr:hypothetical protein [Thermosediminibacterales bacterium]